VVVSDAAGQCNRRCEASVCGMVARVCGVVCLCGVYSVSGEDYVLDVGCAAMMRESRCEAVRVVVWWWLCVWMMLMRMRGRGCCVWLCADVSLSENGLRAKEYVRVVCDVTVMRWELEGRAS
jgi:hypothetical protein